MRNTNWQYEESPMLGSLLNSVIRMVKALKRSELPDIRKGRTIIVGSDYSGQHSTSEYEALAFVLADLEGCGHWSLNRKWIREEYLSDGRRMSYKTLKDKKRAAAVYDFLNAANFIPGLLLVVLVHKSIDSLFELSDSINMDDPEMASFVGWSPHVVERLLRVCHFISLFLSGLSRQGQHLFWFTDQDDIAANPKKLTELTKTLEDISSHYLRHDLGHAKVGTTASDNGDRFIEDFVAIADIAAGALCETLNVCRRESAMPVREFILPLPELGAKTGNVMDWFALDNLPLKRLVLCLDPVPNSKRVYVGRLKLHRISL